EVLGCAHRFAQDGADGVPEFLAAPSEVVLHVVGADAELARDGLVRGVSVHGLEVVAAEDLEVDALALLREAVLKGARRPVEDDAAPRAVEDLLGLERLLIGKDLLELAVGDVEARDADAPAALLARLVARPLGQEVPERALQ